MLGAALLGPGLTSATWREMATVQARYARDRHKGIGGGGNVQLSIVSVN